MKKIMENIYQIKLELKNNPLKEVNCYLIKDNISFLIDTGFNIKKNFNFISSELKKMDISLNSLHVLITHMHSDHCGLSYDFQKCGAKIYATKADADIINSATRLDYWEKIAKLGIKNGFPFKKKLNDIKNHPAYEYHIKNKVKFTYLKNDDIIKKGGYSFRVIETPGHSPGHICLYDSKKGILFTGDHILSNISPNIYPEIGIKNPLKDYLESLKKIKKLRPKRVFPHIEKRLKISMKELQNYTIIIW
ncbi:MAG: MBL fold metallo-hydrolase [Clostridiales Family XIII bacterium]|jgi:glyoxylase-like metal-dependent hydrolase (beta-lactamase superfamily II)|nr:MBL fold metallo-hydrolase [Clostridiales Family XIII bacterium]